MATNKRLIKSNDEGGGGASFNTVLYTGNGTSQSITGVGFQPDLVWAKSRSISQNNVLATSVQGVYKGLISNLTIEEFNSTETLTSFDSDGFSIGNNLSYNTNNATMVAWCWKAGGAAVTNTDGTITSQVSANPAAGFSIVSYTGNGTANSNVGHGLGVAPNIIITKRRSEADSWHVTGTTLGLDNFLFLDTTMSTANAVGYFPLPTNNVISFGSNITPSTNNSGSTYIAYCFAEVPGFSKFGSYSGTNASGNKQTIGFEPAFILIKETTRALDWYILDNKRNSTNPRTTILEPNTSDAEQTFPQGLNFESDGFSFTGAYFNDSGSTFIYMAFANQF